ncbi:MAG: hypothetical protein HUK20_09000 [Fibrobacter sp.]|nr:hypothetical protein [Fibrobacter sp.]
MKPNFFDVIETANKSKSLFDSNIEGLKEQLHNPTKISMPSVQLSPRTGWLKGFLSYPWVLVCSVIPAFKTFM